MKKNIAYYLEDPERLSEISLHELNKWVEEMPYSQPLRLLVDLKSDQFVSSVDEDSKRYGTYFAEDYEPLSIKKNEELIKSPLAETKVNIAPVEVEVSEQSNIADSEIDVIVESDKSTVLDVLTNEVVQKAEIENSEVEKVEEEEITESQEFQTEVEAQVEELPVLAHSLVDDMSEDLLEEDLLEVNPNVVLVNEISHEEADEILEGELENEVLEVIEEEVDELVLEEEEILLEVEVDAESESELEEIVEEDPKEQYSGLVDYKSYVVGVSDDAVITPSGTRGVTIDEVVVAVKTDKKSKKKKSKKPSNKKKSGKGLKKKKEDKKSKKKTAVKDKVEKTKKKDRKKSKKVKAKKYSAKKTEKIKALKIKKGGKRSDKKEIANVETGAVKKIKGSIIEKSDSKEPMSIKGKAKKIKQEVKYVVVNEATTNDFKLKNYDGVSKFANWLLEQKSINGNNDDIPKEKIEVVGKKKDKKKKKKGKKSKVLKVAQDSVKKSEMILSEPLANIMAAQGHTKKAKKMYKQLGLIFPEKSGYFAAKIENLKKK